VNGNARPTQVTVEIADSTSTRRLRVDAKTVLESLWGDVEAAKRALAKGRVQAIAHSARGLLTSLESLRVRVELAYASAAFSDALEERELAEEWVTFAVTARATLEDCVKSGASELAADLAGLDEELEDARDAVLLLEPEDYKEALGGTPPKTKAWWGERARIDSKVREIDLERALGMLR
jgi:hypothetical protein